MSSSPTFQDMSMKQKIAYFKEKQVELQKLEEEFKNKSELNRAELQLAFGITPGKPVSVVDLMAVITSMVE